MVGYVGIFGECVVVLVVYGVECIFVDVVDCVVVLWY